MYADGKGEMLEPHKAGASDQTSPASCAASPICITRILPLSLRLPDQAYPRLFLTDGAMVGYSAGMRN